MFLRGGTAGTGWSPHMLRLTTTFGYTGESQCIPEGAVTARVDETEWVCSPVNLVRACDWELGDTRREETAKDSIKRCPKMTGETIPRRGACQSTLNIHRVPESHPRPGLYCITQVAYFLPLYLTFSRPQVAAKRVMGETERLVVHHHTLCQLGHLLSEISSKEYSDFSLPLKFIESVPSV